MKKISLVKIILGLGLLFFLYYKIGFTEILKEISKMDLMFIPVILIILFFTFLIATINIQLFVKVLRYKIKLKKLFKLYLLSWSMGLIIPGKLGEFSLVFLLKNEGVGLGEGLSITLLDKLITTFSLAVISIVGLLFIFNLPQTSIIIIIIILGIVIPVLLVSSNSVRRFIRRYILGKYEKKFKGFSKTLFSLMKNKAALFNLCLTTIKWAVSALILWLFFFSLGENVPIIQIFFINAIAMIVSLIPITIGGLGIREGTAIYLYSIVNIQPSVVASVYLLFISLNYIVGSLTFILTGSDKRKIRTNQI